MPIPRSSIRQEMLADLAGPGGVWVLTGPPGIGKSHLARRFQDELPSGARMVWARGISRQEALRPFWSVAHELQEGARARKIAAVARGVAREVRYLKDSVGALV
ncbi:MAG TPA: ATP-binding protein, partial [Thermoanaerobaculia bacterium]|nr:ATP-binding protein [Thermoanaerobaculia bacterium]